MVHASIQDNHLHFIIEIENKRSLSMGMQGLAISLAKRLDVVRGRGGKVFAHRYHATTIRTPRQMRNTLSYVLDNWRHHREDRDQRRRFGALDPFATGLKRLTCVGTFTVGVVGNMIAWSLGMLATSTTESVESEQPTSITSSSARISTASPR